MISENHQNQILETFVTIKMDAEYNGTTPAISFDRFDVYFDMFSKSHQNSSQKGFWPDINRQARKGSRTDMDSATFETLKTTVTFLVSIFCTSENPRNVTLEATVGLAV